MIRILNLWLYWILATQMSMIQRSSMHTELEKNRTKGYLSSVMRKTQTNEHIIESLSLVPPNMTCSEEKLAKNITVAKNDVESNNEPNRYNS